MKRGVIMHKKIYLIFYILFLSVVFLFALSNICFGAYPRLIATMFNAFQEIKTWIIRIATPAAAVAVRYRGVYEEI